MGNAIIGTGNVGLLPEACVADFGHAVSCVDDVAGRIEVRRTVEISSYECALGGLIERHARPGHLHFLTGMRDAMRHVGTGASRS